MLKLLIDTSTWLDLAKSRDGQQLIHPIASLLLNGELELLVPDIVRDEFDRNRPRAEEAVTEQVLERFRSIRRDLREYGGPDAGEWIEEMNYQVPFVSATMRQNFARIDELLQGGTTVAVESSARERALQRGIDKRAPFVGNRNSSADALLIELFHLAGETADSGDTLWFVTNNFKDFSELNGDRNRPHADIANYFNGSSLKYIYGHEKLATSLSEALGYEFDELVSEAEIVHDEPRTLGEILTAEKERFDKIWYVRNLIREEREAAGEADPPPLDIREGAEKAKERIIHAYGAANVGPWDDWHWGYIHGEMSALRWVLGDEWDFLDT